MIETRDGSNNQLDNYRTIREIVREYLDKVRLGAGSLSPAVPTGFTDIDRLTGGLYPGDLIILAGSPTSGKSSLVLNIAFNAAFRFAQKVGFFSLQSSRYQIAERLLSAQSGVDPTRIRTGRLSETDIRKLVDSVEIISASSLYIDDTPELDITELRTQVVRISQEVNPDLIIIDSLQLIAQPERQRRALQIPKELKSMATEINKPVLVTSQLTRSVDLRSNHIPQLSDIRGGRSVENEADLVMLMYREDFYDFDTERRGLVDIYVRKHRNGQTGMISLLFLERNCKFTNLEWDDPEGQHYEPGYENFFAHEI